MRLFNWKLTSARCRRRQVQKRARRLHTSWRAKVRARARVCELSPPPPPPAWCLWSDRTRKRARQKKVIGAATARKRHRARAHVLSSSSTLPPPLALTRACARARYNTHVRLPACASERYDRCKVAAAAARERSMRTAVISSRDGGGDGRHQRSQVCARIPCERERNSRSTQFARPTASTSIVKGRKKNLLSSPLRAKRRARKLLSSNFTFIAAAAATEHRSDINWRASKFSCYSFFVFSRLLSKTCGSARSKL